MCVPSTADAAALADLEDVQVLVWDGSAEPPADIADVTFFVGPYMSSAGLAAALARLPRLQVVQLLSAGVESWVDAVPAGVTLCNGRGIHGASTAELALAGLLAVLRQLPRYHDDQAAHRWSSQPSEGLAGKRVLVLGAGDIGQHVGRQVEAFDAHATYVGRTARPGVHARADLPALLPHHNVVVVAMPLTSDTDRLVDAGFLEALPDQAVVVNVARGRIVDTDALLAELTSGRLRAFLDVTEPEPLPAQHPLWSAPNVVITPHVGGGATGWEERGRRLVREQVARFAAAEPLHNIVRHGY